MKPLKHRPLQEIAHLTKNRRSAGFSFAETLVVICLIIVATTVATLAVLKQLSQQGKQQCFAQQQLVDQSKARILARTPGAEAAWNNLSQSERAAAILSEIANAHQSNGQSILQCPASGLTYAIGDAKTPTSCPTHGSYTSALTVYDGTGSIGGNAPITTPTPDQVPTATPEPIVVSTATPPPSSLPTPTPTATPTPTPTPPPTPTPTPPPTSPTPHPSPSMTPIAGQ